MGETIRIAMDDGHQLPCYHAVPPGERRGGLVLVQEIFGVTDHIRELILEKRPTSEIKKAAREDGMRFLRESAVERVLDGHTTLREINKVTFVE